MKHIKDNFLVVSDYNWLPDNLEESWVHKYSDNYLIYDRYHRYPESDKVKHQTNVGQNMYDIFDYIITNYHSLPENIIFCKASFMYKKDDGIIRYDANGKRLATGNCSEEYFLKNANNTYLTELHDFFTEPHRFDGISNKIGPDNSYLEIYNSWYFTLAKGKYYNDINKFFQDMYINPPNHQYFRFAPGGNYIIPKANILKYSLKFYEQIRTILSWNVTSGEAHMVERAVYTIFTCNYEVRDEYK